MHLKQIYEQKAEKQLKFLEGRKILQILRVPVKTKPRKRLSYGVLLFRVWCHSESNQGHTDFQSVALPAELWHPVLGLQI